MTMPKPVVGGATIQCNQGAAPGKLVPPRSACTPPLPAFRPRAAAVKKLDQATAVTQTETNKPAFFTVSCAGE
jgi:hypothetical protein